MSSSNSVPPPPTPPDGACKSYQIRPVVSNGIVHKKELSHFELNAEHEFTEARNRLWELEGWKDSPLLTVYQYLPPILQEGPQCGLVALAMAATSTETNLSVREAFLEAQSRGFSCQGEMFSVDDMATLAHSLIPRITTQVIKGLSDNRELVVHSLARGAILLVPYDADRNHEPCCRKGHKAHWAAICGALVCNHRCLVVARQGKSRRLMLWDFDQLAASNDNLMEFSPGRGDDKSKYILPEGGVLAGLCGRAVLLQRDALQTAI